MNSSPTGHPVLARLIAEEEERERQAARQSRAQERTTLLAELTALRAEMATVLPRQRAEVARLNENAAQAAAEAGEGGNVLHMLESRFSRREAQLGQALAERPSEAQDQALRRLDAEIEAECGRAVDPSRSIDLDARVRVLRSVRSQIADLSTEPNEVHAERIAALLKTMPERIPDEPKPGSSYMERMAELYRSRF